jgi:hypothetical protein
MIPRPPTRVKPRVIKGPHRYVAAVAREALRPDRALSSNGTENTHKLAYRSSIPAVRGSRSGLSSPRAMISGSVKA